MTGVVRAFVLGAAATAGGLVAVAGCATVGGMFVGWSIRRSIRHEWWEWRDRAAEIIKGARERNSDDA